MKKSLSVRERHRDALPPLSQTGVPRFESVSQLPDRGHVIDGPLLQQVEETIGRVISPLIVHTAQQQEQGT